jgi:Uma2 family endonuclease
MTLADPPISQQFLLDDVDWDFYEALLERVGDRHIFVTYDSGRLELMSPSYQHDKRSRYIGLIINAVAVELGIRMQGGGSTTFKRKELEKGLEPDQCFYVKNVDPIIGKRTLDLSVDPPPDLAIEVEVTRRMLPRLPIYRALGVAEIWRDDGKHIHVDVLQADGNYREVTTSPSFPMLPIKQVDCFLASIDETDEMTWTREVRAWMQQHLKKG